MDGIFFSFNVMIQGKKWDVIIIGGGLAGLSTALHLSKAGFEIALIEKYTYPHHKVCGEYVSNEVLPYLNFLGVDPLNEGAKKISKLEFTDRNGKSIELNLPLGGFGMSRYALDNLLFQKAEKKVAFIFETVEKIVFEKNLFNIKTQQKGSYNANFIVGAYGKRSNLDSFLNRKFMMQNSPWLAVKSHFEYDMPEDKVALHNFSGGYCGLSKTETNAVNACYLATFKSFQEIWGILTSFQKNVLSQNPNLKHFFAQATPLFPKPLTISQISFSNKSPVENHIFMVGDSAGLIHPLCGNGMAMAIHGAKIFSELLMEYYGKEDLNRNKLEREYIMRWNKTFSKRLKTGRAIQNILMNPFTEKIGFQVVKNIPAVLPEIIKRTHGAETI